VCLFVLSKTPRKILKPSWVGVLLRETREGNERYMTEDVIHESCILGNLPVALWCILTRSAPRLSAEEHMEATPGVFTHGPKLTSGMKHCNTRGTMPSPLIMECKTNPTALLPCRAEAGEGVGLEVQA